MIALQASSPRLPTCLLKKFNAPGVRFTFLIATKLQFAQVMAAPAMVTEAPSGMLKTQEMVVVNPRS